jgi:hypothetical protein
VKLRSELFKNKNHGVHGGTRRRQDNINVSSPVKLQGNLRGKLSELRGEPLKNNYEAHEGTQREQDNTNIFNSVKLRVLRGESFKNENHEGTRKEQDSINFSNSVKLRALRGESLKNNYKIREGTQKNREQHSKREIWIYWN